MHILTVESSKHPFTSTPPKEHQIVSNNYKPCNATYYILDVNAFSRISSSQITIDVLSTLVTTYEGTINSWNQAYTSIYQY